MHTTSDIHSSTSWLVLVVPLAAFGWMTAARIVCGMTLSLREREFVTVARFMGVSPWRITFRHVPPNMSSIPFVDATMGMGVAILAESGLSFFGFGVQPLAILSFTLIGDGLRDALDPGSASLSPHDTPSGEEKGTPLMRFRPRCPALVALAAVTALVLAGCGGGDSVVGGADQRKQGVNDVNPLPRAQVRDGGDLRWPLDAIPDNFNRNQLDGTQLENQRVMSALLPGAFRTLPDASVELDTDYFTSVELTSQRPQVVTYTINPEAVWDDGAPITWVDLQAQWRAQNGTDPAFLVARTTGYRDIASVERGADDKQAVVTFARTFAEWRDLFDALYPASTNIDPATFNEGWIHTVRTTAGPFRAETVDTAAQTITLVRNDAWWGEPAKLDRIIFRVVERRALADALANDEIDFYAVGADVNLFQRSQGIQGIEIRRAVEPTYTHITFNGGEGAILADPALRRAVARGIDRQAIANALIGRIVPGTTPLGSYLYVQGSANHVDHSQSVAFDPAAAAAALDGLGWLSTGGGQVRTKDGRPLTLRYVVTAANPTAESISRLTQAQLAAIGVGVELVPASSDDLFDEFVTPGNFDMVSFTWTRTVFPVSTRTIYATTGDQNYGDIGTPEIDALYDKAVQELDDAARTELLQEIDQAIWEQMPQLPLFQSTGAYAVRSTLANFGAYGFGDVKYADAGFTR